MKVRQFPLVHCLRSLAILSFIAFFAYPRLAVAQKLLPLSGTRFTFSILEGADNLPGAQQGSDLELWIGSDKNGCGIILSPNGYKQTFVFGRDSATHVPINIQMMLLNDVGKTNKGIVVLTSQPVSLMLHDYLPEAGDATQILPDDALDTGYLVAAWGIYDDPGEDNHSEFVVTAVEDSTVVTIIPTVRNLNSLPPNQPFVVTLNRGEDYVVKADRTGVPVNTSLAESRVSATKPVSVFTGVTCGYVPLGVESCNEVLDELVPRSAWGTDYYVTPLNPNGDEDILFLTSDVQNYTVFVPGLTYFAANGHVQIPFSQAMEFSASVPVQCEELIEGSNNDPLAGSDPSMVTVLPMAQYRDTLAWVTPYSFFDVTTGPVFFTNYFNGIIPSGLTGQIVMDGKTIDQWVTAQLAGVTSISATTSSVWIQLDSGFHFLTSPQPVFGVVNGFSFSDAYSHLTGSVSLFYNDTIAANTRMALEDSEVFCKNFGIEVLTDSVIGSAKNVLEVIDTITFDPTKLHVNLVSLSPSYSGSIITVDSSILGRFVITVSAPPPLYPPISIEGSLLQVSCFSTDPTRANTTVRSAYSYQSIFFQIPPTGGVDSFVVHPPPLADTVQSVAMTVVAGTTTLGNLDTATISITPIDPAMGVKAFTLLLTYDHDILTYDSALVAGFLLDGWKVSAVDSIGPNVDALTFTSATDTLHGSGTLLRLIFKSFVSDSATTLLRVSGSFPVQSTPCPTVGSINTAQALFVGRLLCGDSEFIKSMGINGLTIESIVPNPNPGFFTLALRSALGETATITISDVLGRTAWTDVPRNLVRGQQSLSFSPLGLAPGNYVLRVSTPSGTVSRMVEMVR